MKTTKDVYKRQRRRLAAAVITVTVCCALRRWGMTVSYTHLDVYKRQLYKQCRADRQHGLDHTVWENKLRAVLIYDRLDFAGVRFLRKAFLNAVNVFCGVPKLSLIHI